MLYCVWNNASGEVWRSHDAGALITFQWQDIIMFERSDLGGLWRLSCFQIFDKGFSCFLASWRFLVQYFPSVLIHFSVHNHLQPAVPSSKISCPIVGHTGYLQESSAAMDLRSFLDFCDANAETSLIPRPSQLSPLTSSIFMTCCYSNQ